jgi:hypothetical protein
MFANLLLSHLMLVTSPWLQTAAPVQPPAAPCKIEITGFSYDYSSANLKTTWTATTDFPSNIKLILKVKRDSSNNLLENQADDQQPDAHSRSFSVPLTDIANASTLTLWLDPDLNQTCEVTNIRQTLQHSIFLRAVHVGELEAQLKQSAADKDSLNKQYSDLKGKLAESESKRTGIFPKSIEFKGIKLKSDRMVILQFWTAIPGRIKVSATGDTSVSPQSTQTFQNDHVFRFDNLKQGGTYNFKAEVLDLSGDPIKPAVTVDSQSAQDLAVHLLPNVHGPDFNILSLTPTPHAAEVKMKLSQDCYVQITARELVDPGAPIHIEPVVVGSFERDAVGIIKSGKPTAQGEQSFNIALSPGKQYTLEFRVEDVYGNKGSRIDPDTSLFVPAKTPSDPPTFAVADAVNITLNPLGSKFSWKATRPASKGEIQVSVKGQSVFRIDAIPDQAKTTLTANVPYTEFLKIMNVTEAPTLTIRMWAAEGDQQPVEQNLKIGFEVPSKEQVAKAKETQPISSDLENVIKNASNQDKKISWKDWLKVGLGVVATFAK